MALHGESKADILKRARPGTALKDIIDQINGIANVDRIIAIDVAVFERTGCRAGLEYIVDQIDGVTHVRGAIRVGVAGKTDRIAYRPAFAAGRPFENGARPLSELVGNDEVGSVSKDAGGAIDT